VLLEPLAQEAIGLACVDGVCIARVKMLDEGHRFAEIKVSDATMLLSGASGSAALLWVQPAGERDPDPTVAWVVAKIGLPAGAGSIAGAMITSKAGTAPPYRYAAAQATMDADGIWTRVEGGQAYNDVFNIEEQGSGGQWVNPLNVKDPVVILILPGAASPVCMRAHYRGSY